MVSIHFHECYGTNYFLWTIWYTVCINCNIFHKSVLKSSVSPWLKISNHFEWTFLNLFLKPVWKSLGSLYYNNYYVRLLFFSKSTETFFHFQFQGLCQSFRDKIYGFGGHNVHCMQYFSAAWMAYMFFL